MQLVKILILPPHTCWICGEKGDENSNRDFFIDTQKDTWDEGQVAFCSQCIIELCKLVPGVKTQEEVNEIVSVQAEAVANAHKVLGNWEVIKEACRIAGLDLEKLIDGRDRVPEESSDDSSGDNQEPVPETPTRSGLALGLLGNLSNS